MEITLAHERDTLSMESQDMARRTLSVLDQARVTQVVDEQSGKRAADLLTVIKALRTQVNDTFDPIIKRAHETHKEAITQKKKIESPLVEAEEIVKPRIAAYQDLQEQKIRQEEERARQDAIKRAEESRLADAVAAEQVGMNETAESILEGPAYAPTLIASRVGSTIEGVSFRKLWKHKILDPRLLPEEYKMPDDKKIARVVRALREQTNIPGVHVYAESSVTTRE